MSWADVLGPIAGIVLGGGLVTGVVAYKKAPAETQLVFVSAAEKVVVIQRDALEDATARYDELERRFDLLAARIDAQAAEASEALRICHEERMDLLRHNEELIRRIGALEREVARLRTQ